MTILARGQRSHSGRPALDAFFIVSGLLVDPGAIEFAIFDRTAGVQVFPPTEGDRALVDLADAPLGDRLSPGRYVADWTAPEDAATGPYEVRWWYRILQADTVEWVFVTSFEIVESLPPRYFSMALPTPCYAEVATLREEGVPTSVTDATLVMKLVLASRLFEQFTGRSFEPRYKAMQLAPQGSRVVMLEEPIIALLSVHIGTPANFELEPGTDLGVLRVYNRHLQGLLDPDDREAPRIEYASLGYWADGYGFGFARRSVTVRGVFGYTDPDSSPTGSTPMLVARAVALMAFRDLAKLADVASRDDALKRWKLTGETTRDQSYSMFGGVDAATRGALVGGTTGDPELDHIIHLYRRGPRLGAA